VTVPVRTGRPTRAEAAELDELIRRAAVEAFVTNGFQGTTIEGVAAAAGVTKRTLYARYADKRALLADAIGWAMASLQWHEPPEPPDPDDLEGALVDIGRFAVARVLDPDVVRLTRLAAMESHRFPEFARSARSLMWSPRMQAVTRLLQRHAEQGTVVVDDVDLAAEQFLTLVTAMPARLAAFGVHRTAEEEERHLRHAVRLFLHGALAR
jgi:AcrR family transcriptional regulator